MNRRGFFSRMLGAMALPFVPKVVREPEPKRAKIIRRGLPSPTWGECDAMANPPVVVPSCNEEIDGTFEPGHIFWSDDAQELRL